jgi:polyphosphate kinase
MTAHKEFTNRELSWIEFNQRVLDEATNRSVPLLERLKFLAISAANLNEFFMVRVGGLQILKREGYKQPDASGMPPEVQLKAIAKRIREMLRSQYSCLRRSIEPQLTKHGLCIYTAANISPDQHSFLRQVFLDELLPVISPIRLDPEVPLPLVSNLGLNLLVRLKSLPGAPEPFLYAMVPLPANLERFIRLPTERGDSFMPLEEIVRLFAQELFHDEQLMETVMFRVTRNADMSVREDLAADLMKGMQDILLQRKLSECVRLEIENSATVTTLRFLKRILKISDLDVYKVPGPLDLSAFMSLVSIDGYDHLKYAPWPPQQSPEIDLAESIMDQIAKRDFLFCHPYESYDPVVRFIEEAADDPKVLAIKQILYRTSKTSPIIRALKRAAEHGKYVTVLVELKARFDEARNIEWARELEYAGVQVVYGVKNLKTHAKLCLVVRREPQGIVRYMHFGTGNYNEKTARLYSDISYMTCNEEYGADASAFFNAITGYSQPQDYLKVATAPINLRDRFLTLIEGEIERKKQGQKAVIKAKMNSLVDPALIEALYRASAAGVKVMLNIRGICCLRPGVARLSKNITATSIIDRYLEHARIFYFYHGGEEITYIASADWMPRNLDRRIELGVPVEDPACRRKLLAILNTYFKDNVKSRKLNGDGSYDPPAPPRYRRIASQERLYNQAREAVENAAAYRRTVFEAYNAASE